MGTINKKTFFISIFFVHLVGLCLLFLGCERKSTVDIKEKKTSIRHGGVVVFSNTSDPKSFNDIISAETSTSAAISNLFDGLTRLNGITGKVVPALAEAWDHSPDGLTWTFYLRKDVLWFDGETFTADDVVFTYNDLVYNENIPCSMRDLLTIDGKKFDISKIDDYTVRIKTPVPYAPLLRHMSQSILPKHRLEESVRQGNFTSTWGVDTPPDKIIGTGPYKLVEYLPSQKLVYERNPNYWKKDELGNRLPYIDKIVTVIVPNDDVQVAKFQAGEIDSLNVRPKDYAYVKPLEAQKDFTLYEMGPSFSSSFLMFNQNVNTVPDKKIAWFADRNFRKAVAYALDRRTIINNVYAGMGVPQKAAISEADPLFHNDKVMNYDFDPEKARSLLAESGFVDSDSDGMLEKPAGTPVEFILVTNADNSQRKDMAVIITENLRAVGIDVSFRTLDFNNLVQKLDVSMDWECMILGLAGGNLEPHGSKNVWDPEGRIHMWNKKPQDTRNKTMSAEKRAEETKTYEERYKKWRDSLPEWEFEIKELFDKGVQELDENKRKKYYDRWQEIVAEELPLIYLVTPKSFSAVRNKFIGIQPSSFAGVFHNFEELYLKEEYR